MARWGVALIDMPVCRHCVRLSNPVRSSLLTACDKQLLLRIKTNALSLMHNPLARGGSRARRRGAARRGVAPAAACRFLACVRACVRACVGACVGLQPCVWPLHQKPAAQAVLLGSQH